MGSTQSQGVKTKNRKVQTKVFLFAYIPLSFTLCYMLNIRMFVNDEKQVLSLT